jgi:hypothetical protein
MFIDPELMDDDQLIIEIEGTEEELDLFGAITILQAEKMPFDPRVSVQEISERLDQLIFEGSKRGLCRPNFRLV